MDKQFYPSIALGTCVGLGMILLIVVYRTMDNEKPQALTVVTKEDIEAEFFAYIDKLSRDETQKQKYAEIVEKFTQIVGEEARKNPQAMSSHIEEMIRLVPRAGPGIAIQFEEYASVAVREEMNKLRQESNVVKLDELKKENIQLNKEIIVVREKERIFSSKFPVLLLNNWTDSIAEFKITNASTKELRVCSIGAPKDFASGYVVYLEPGEYSVEISGNTLLDNALDRHTPYKNTIMVQKEPFIEMPYFKGFPIEYSGKKFHAKVGTPSI